GEQEGEQVPRNISGRTPTRVRPGTAGMKTLQGLSPSTQSSSSFVPSRREGLASAQSKYNGSRRVVDAAV
ncbi:unnamed protein product, partial [Amoebophrya sp. A120]